MALPKKKQVKHSIDINPPKIGNEFLKYGMDRIEKLMNATDVNTKYLPRTIIFDDLDQAMYDYVNEGNIKLLLNGKKIPVFYLENDRWGEFSKTWKFMDDDKNVPTPYITVRRTNKSPGSRLGNKSIIPQQRKFRYLDVPILDNGEVIYLRFKMPEPINVDIIYNVSLFTKYRVDVNRYDEMILKRFSSKQDYVYKNNTPFPILLESIEEPKSLENIDGDRFYVSTYTIKLMGYIQDEKEFEITKTFRKTKIGISIEN